MTIKPNKHNALQTLCSHSFSDFIDTLKGERQFKPPNQFTNRNWVRVGPSLPANAKFDQANTVLIQVKALKAFIYRVFHVLYQNIVSNLSSVSAAGSLLDPPLRLQAGGVCFRTPELKFFNFL
jgi:hypothetical protein